VQSEYGPDCGGQANALLASRNCWLTYAVNLADVVTFGDGLCRRSGNLRRAENGQDDLSHCRFLSLHALSQGLRASRFASGR
jgi:hypothetical protein